MPKTCTKCQRLLPPDFFNKMRGGKNGLRGICKQCQSTYNYIWFRNHREVRNAQKLRDEQNHPDRRYARFVAWKNVPIGRKCSVCGSTEKLHRHHHDYSKPLEVITLCQVCHLGRKFGSEVIKA
jgi:hypothetical protein